MLCATVLLRFLNFILFFNESNSLSAFSCQVYNLLSIFWDCHWQHIPLLSFSHDLHKEKIVDSLSCLFFSSSVQLVNYLLEWIHGKKKKYISCMWIKFAKASTVTSFILSIYSALLDLKKQQQQKKTNPIQAYSSDGFDNMKTFLIWGQYSVTILR